MSNLEIRGAAKRHGVCLWQIADALGVADANFSRKLRKELPDEEKTKILELIRRIAEEVDE